MPVGCLWASTAVRFRAVVLLLLIVVPIVGFCNCSMFCCAYFVSYTSFAVILMGKRGLVALLCLHLVIVVWLSYSPFSTNYARRYSLHKTN